MPRAPVFLFDGFRLDRRDGLRRVLGGDREKAVVLGSRALDVLLALVERDGDLVARQALMNAAWPGLAVEESNLAVQISTLRRILDEGRGGGSCIQTVIGRGYRFLPTVTSRDAIPGEMGIEPASTVPGRAEVARSRLSVVVLPFKNIGGDPGGDNLAETITDELTTDLSSWSFALVIAGTSAGSCAAGSMDVRLVGAELGVRYAIRGSVRGAAERTNVNVQLIDVETGAQLWADRFETDDGAVAKARDEMVGRLQRGLSRKLIEDVSRGIEALPPDDWSVYDLNMRGRVFMMRPQSIANRRAAMNSFEQALQRDPGSDAARIGIANVLIGNILDNWTTSIEEDAARAEQLLLQVLQGDSDVCEAHASMGKLRRIQGRLSDSRLELEMAIAMSPNFHIAIGQLGVTLAFLGEPEAAIPWIEKSLRLGSHDSMTALDQGKMGLCYLMLGDSDSAVTWLRKARAGNMRMYYIHMWLAAGLGLRGELDEARASVREAIEIAPDICSLVALRARWRMMTSSPRFFALAEKTLVAGLRRAGLPEGE